MTIKNTFGLALILSGLILPAIVYVGGQLYNSHVASYGGPPDQGAMILAGIVFVISVAVGGCLALVGIVLRNVPHRKTPQLPSRPA